MANTDWAFGLMPYKEVLRARVYTVITNPVINVFIGDAVIAGGVNTLSKKMGYCQSIEDANIPDGNPGILGAVLACYDEKMDPLKYIPATRVGAGGVAGHVLVADHPDQEFVMREDFGGNAITLAEGSQNANIKSVAICAGNTKTGRSQQMIDSNTAGNAAALNLKLIAPHPNDTLLVADDTPGDSADEGCRYICQINEHYYGDSIAGIA